jgi:hypothetical protein
MSSILCPGTVRQQDYMHGLDRIRAIVVNSPVMKVLSAIFLMCLLTLPALSQDKLYPVTNRNAVVVLNADRSSFVVERSFSHKLSLGFPTENKVFLPDSEPPMVMLWMRIQNVSERRLPLNTAKFTITDDQGRTYPALSMDEATRRIVAAFSDATNSAKALRSLSGGRFANKPTEEQFKADIPRYSLQPTEISPGSAKEGLIYFDRPAAKNFTVSVSLGDLWSQPFVFSTQKQK